MAGNAEVASARHVASVITVTVHRRGGRGGQDQGQRFRSPGGVVDAGSFRHLEWFAALVNAMAPPSVAVDLLRYA